MPAKDRSRAHKKKGSNNECVNRRLRYKVEQVVNTDGKSREKEKDRHWGEYSVGRESEIR